MNSVFRDKLRKFVLVFFDDILVYSKSWEDHQQHLEMVFSVLASHSLFANLSKCEFGCVELSYLGHRISDQGVAVEPDKVSAIQKWPLPATIKELRGFLGLCGYYRRFVYRYASTTAPLTKLLCKNAFVWTKEATGAFEALKHALATTPVLAMPDFSNLFVLQTDASGSGIGGVLVQKGRPIAYFSKELPSKLRRESAYCREMFAITEAIQKWRQYLLGRRFIVETDHQSLRALHNQTIQTPEQQKWLTKLLGFDFDICYRPGRENQPADSLSRLVEHTYMALQIVSKPVMAIWDALKEFYQQHPPSAHLMQSAQQDDSTGYAVREGLLWFNGKVVVPPDSALQRLILTEFHNTPVGGHAGMQRTLSRIASMFYWPKMRQLVRDFVARCQVCQAIKPFNKAPQGLLQPLPIPGKIWDSISMDFVTHLPPASGKSVIMVVVDRLSKQAHFAVLPGAFNAPMVAALFIKEIVRLHGFPTIIISDRDPVFMSSFWQELFKLQGTTLATSSAYHPQTDGQTEVLNRCLEDYLRCFVADNPKQWSHYLSWAEWHYNTAYHSTIKMTPFEAVYGRPPPSLLDYLGDSASIDAVDALLKDRTQILSTLKDSLLRAQTRMRNQTNTHRTDVTFQVDDWVFLKLKPYRQTTVAHCQSQKLSKRFFGPFRIIAKIGAVAYKLALPEDARIHNVFHVSNLKKCRGDQLEHPQIPLPARFKDSSPILQPAHVLGFRQISQLGKLCPQLLIQWEGQDPSDATWENTHEFQQDFPDFNLEDKVSFEDKGNDAGPLDKSASEAGEAQQNPVATNNKHVTRIRNAPKRFKDFVMATK